ncbi:unnamed protein product, partial [Didymodactylos carnosus]
ANTKAADCVYIYGVYFIEHYLLPERLEVQKLKEKYERDFGCTLNWVNDGSGNAELALVSKDVTHLISELEDDGFNQRGCFADTTNFKPINPPCTFDNRTTVQACFDYTTTHNTTLNYAEIIKHGYINTARCTALSQSQRCKTFALQKLTDYLAPPLLEAKSFENGTFMEFDDQFLELIEIQKGLNDDNAKPQLIAEYWADGPGSTATPGHWQSITLNMIHRLCYDNNDAVKILFVVSAATYDAGLAAWQNKRLLASFTYYALNFSDDREITVGYVGNDFFQ